MSRAIKVVAPGYGNPRIDSGAPAAATTTSSSPSSTAAADTRTQVHSPTRTPSQGDMDGEGDLQEILSNDIGARLRPDLTDGLADTLGKTILGSTSSPNTVTDTKLTRSGNRERTPSSASTSRTAADRADHRRRGSSSSRHSVSSVDAHSDTNHSTRSRSSFGDSGSYLPTDLGRPGVGKAPVFPLKAGAQTNRSKYKREQPSGPSPATTSLTPPNDCNVSSAAAVTTNAEALHLAPVSTEPSPSPSILPRRSTSQLSLRSSKTSSSNGTRATTAEALRRPDSVRSAQSSGFSTGVSTESTFLSSAAQPQSIFAKPEHTKRPVVDLLPKFFKQRGSVDASVPSLTNPSPQSSTNNPYLAARRESKDKGKKTTGRGGARGGSLAVLGAALATSQSWTPMRHPTDSTSARRDSQITLDRRPSSVSPSIISRESSYGTRRPSATPDKLDFSTNSLSTEEWVLANQAPAQSMSIANETANSTRPETSLPPRRDVFAVRPRARAPSAT
ncbi:hypothetical protein OIV83_000983 [Microbotryomycetes sp. JL201]|nr:hypothetical protein OIV83_000983 [Microbotryomycetes sp. JL201]